VTSLVGRRVERRTLIAALQAGRDLLVEGPAGTGKSVLVRDVAAACEPLNVAGLCDPSKHNSYGVDLEDTVRGAAKLGLSPGHVRGALAVMMSV